MKEEARYFDQLGTTSFDISWLLSLSFCDILPSDVCRFKFQASCEGQMWEFALVNASTYKCHYTPGSTTSWHHHLSKLFWPEKVRNLYVTFWCQQGAEMSLVSNGSFQKITITTSNQSPIHKIIHQYFLISFASKYPLHQLCPGLVCSVSADARVCGTPGAVLLVVPLVWIRAVWAEPCTIPIWLVDRKFYLVTPCHCDIEAGVGVTRVWRVVATLR